MSTTATGPAIAPFDPAFAIDVMLPLAQAAYDVALGNTPVLPSGFTVSGNIKVDEMQFLAAMATAAASQRRMLDAMKVDGNIFGLTAVNAATQTVVASFRGTQTLEDWLADFDFVAVPYECVQHAGNVHMGFQLVYHSVRNSVKQLIGQAWPPDARTSGSPVTAWEPRSPSSARRPGVQCQQDDRAQALHLRRAARGPKRRSAARLPAIVRHAHSALLPDSQSLGQSPRSATEDRVLRTRRPWRPIGRRVHAGPG